MKRWDSKRFCFFLQLYKKTILKKNSFYIDIQVHVFMRVYISRHVYLYVHTCTCMCTNLFLRLYMSVRIGIYVSAWFRIHTFTYKGISDIVCISFLSKEKYMTILFYLRSFFFINSVLIFIWYRIRKIKLLGIECALLKNMSAVDYG